MDFEAISTWLRNTLLPYGGFGLMVLAMCDSSFVSLPEVNDILLMTFAINDPGGMIKFAFLTTMGSVIGCALLYAVGRKGGETFLRKTFHGERSITAASAYAIQNICFVRRHFWHFVA
jgi:membrane protein DedA with SNARE-associated domain